MYKYFVAGLLLPSTLAQSAAIDTNQSTANSTKSDQVIVSASRLEEDLPQQLAKYGTNVDVITTEEIKNTGYVDVASVLNSLTPGLYINQKNGPFDYVDISLLGSRTQDVLWLVDGVRINNRLYATTTPLDTVPAGIVDRMEVLEGGQALFYGTQAVAGAINIVTKEFSNTPDGSVTAGLDTNDGQHFDGYYRDTIDKHQFVVFASSDKSDGYHAFRSEDYQPSATDRDRGYDVLSLGAKYAYNASDDLRLSASYIHTDADLDDAKPYRADKSENSRVEQLATAKIDFDASDKLSLYLKTYYHWWDTHYDTTYNSLTVPGTTEVLYDNAYWGYKDYGVNALAKFKFDDRFDYYIGYDYQRYGGKDDVLVIEQQDEHTNAVFGQIRTSDSLFANTKLAAGVRYNKPNVGESATVWNLSGEHHFNENLYARTTFGTNFRLPTAEELFANDPNDERGNPNLKPEKTTSLNASLGGFISLSKSPMEWELTGFVRKITDLIDLDTFDEDTQQDVFGNIHGTVHVRGGEAIVKIPVTENILTSLSYTYNHSEDSNTNEQLLRVPRTLAKAMLAYVASGNRYGAELWVNYTGDIDTSVSGERVGYGNYSVVNLASHGFIDTAQHHRINLSLENVFDKEYGRPYRGCADVAGDGPYDCSAPYTYVNLNLPRTLRASYTYSFQ